MPRLSLPLLNARSARLHFSLFVVLASLGMVFAPGSRAMAQTCSSSPCTISVPGTITANGTSGVATSPVTVTAGGTINNTVGSVSVELDGLSTTYPGGGWGLYFTNIILQGPGGTMVLLGGVGNSSDISPAETITVADNGSLTLTALGTNPAGGNSYKPASFWTNHSHGGSSVLPTGATTAAYPTTDGSATLLNVFSGTTTDGTWKLYIANSGGSGEATNVTITGWKLTIAYTASAKDNTSTTISRDVSHQNLGGNVTFTATVTDTTHSGTIPTGTVTFKNDTTNSTISCGGGSQTLSSGQATCIAAASTLGEGLSTIEADYGGGSSFQTSTSATSPVIELIEGTTTNPSTNVYCNTGSAASPGGGGTGRVYPSIIKVPNLGNTVANITVELNGVSTANEGLRGSFLLVAPDGTHNLDFLDNAFDNTVVSGLTINVQDGHTYPDGTTDATSGTYNPTDNYTLNSVFPTSSPSAHSIDNTIPDVVTAPTYSYPHGSVNNSLEATFSTATTAGDWALYFFRPDAGVETLGSGWCLDFTLNTGTATTTSVASNKNGANTAHVGDSVTITATVTDNNGAVNGGTVSFTENGVAVAGTSGAGVAVSGGQASISTSALTEGDHTIVANYSGDSNDNESSGQVIQRIDHVTTFSYSSGVISACNTGTIASTLQPDSTTNATTGAFTPNPSNIFASKLPGTLKSVTLGLNGLTTGDESIYLTQAMVAGPNSQGLDFFSGTGNSSFGPFGPFNMVFSDSASGGLLPQTSYSAGTYKPTDYNSSDTFYASASGFYPLPGSISQAAPHGTSTFANLFGGGQIIGNGTWSLFFNITAKLLQETVANGWCLNFTQNPVVVDPTLGHSGTGISGDFVEGETAATITVNVANPTSPAGQGSTGDPATTNPLTVTDTLSTASGLSFNSSATSGTDWSCSATGTPQVVTCKNDDSIAQGASYPALTIGVNVAANAPASYANSIQVSGAGVTSTSANDSITIDPTPALAVSVSHTGTFTQGSTGEWDVKVSNTASGGRTSGTMTMTDTLPAGYTLSGSSATGGTWGCGGVNNVVTCTSTSQINGGSFSTIALTVNIPTNSAISVNDSASAFGGGDPIHSTSGTAATSNTDGVTVVQVPASVAITSGDSQSATILTAFTNPLVATVKDAGGVVIANYTPVSFAAATGTNGQSGSFSNSSSMITTSANGSGQVSETIKANNKVGQYSVTVTAGTAQNSFTLTNTVGAPASMSVVSGSGQSTTILTSFGSPMVAQVLDAGSNPVPNATVTFTAPVQTSASVTFSGGVNTATTDASGNATSAGIAANSHAGAYQVTASVGSVQAPFSLTNTVGAPAGMTKVSGDAQSAADTTTFTNPLEVNITDVGGNPVSGVLVTFTAPSSGPSVTFAGGVNTATTDASGNATSAAITANSAVGNFAITATAGALGTGFTETNVVGSYSQLVVSGASGPVYAGVPMQFTVTAEDVGGNRVTTATPTVHFTSTDGAASLPGDATLSGGTGTYTATLNTLGPQTITATDTDTSSIAGTSPEIQVTAIPNLVVTVATDDAGTASNCDPQTAPNASCSLRDALLEASNLGAGSITFDSTAFATSQTITLGSTGTLTIAAYTSITGPTAGVTVSGANATTVFTVNSGVTARLSGLTITNGNASEGGGIYSDGMLTLTNCTLTGNSAGTQGAAIASRSGSLTVIDSTISGNSATYNAGGIFALGSFSIVGSTVSGNTAGSNAGGIDVAGTTTISDSTIYGNSAAGGVGGGIVNAGSATVSNSIIAGNSGVGKAGISNSGTLDANYNVFYNNLDGGSTEDDCNGCTSNNNATTGNPSLAPLGNYGGPTQTMLPLPGSAAICAGSTQFIANGVTTDQRGLPNTNNTYNPGNPCVDAGAVQTSYTMAFSTDPTPNSPYTSIYTGTGFHAAVALNESGVAGPSGVSIPLALNGPGTLTGGSAATAAGLASYPALKVNTAGSTDSLTATLLLNGGLSLSATSGTFAVTNGAPSAVSLSPSSGFGTTQQFTFVASSPTGAANLKYVVMLFNTTVSRVNGCIVTYTVSRNLLSLATDDDTASTSGHVGNSGSLSNSQCSVNLLTSTASSSGDTLTVAPVITFKSGLPAGVRVYMKVEDISGQSTPWVRMGSWMVGSMAEVPPSAVSVSPSSGFGTSQQFTFVASSPNGVGNLATVAMLINNSLSRLNSCTLTYAVAANQLSLGSDDDSTSTSGTPGSPGTLSNSQCSVDLSTVTVTASGNTLTIVPTIAFGSGFMAGKDIYMNVGDNLGMNSGWKKMGWWMVGTTAEAAPSAVSVSPSSGYGNNQQFTFVASSPNGAGNLAFVHMLFSTSPMRLNSCYLSYTVASNQLSLMSDDGNTSTSGQPGDIAILSNSQCSVDLSKATVTPSGNTLTVAPTITFTPGFTTGINIYLDVVDVPGFSTGFKKMNP